MSLHKFNRFLRFFDRFARFALRQKTSRQISHRLNA